MVCCDLEHQIRCAKHTFIVVGVISHLWCAAHLVCIAHHSFYSDTSAFSELSLFFATPIKLGFIKS